MQKTNLTLGGGGFHHVAVRVRDFDLSVAFYTDTLGFKPGIAWGQAPKRAIMLDTGDGNYLELFERPDQPPASPDDEHAILHFAIRTTSVDAAIQRVRDAGMQVTMEPRDVDIANTIPTRPTPVPVRIAFFRGPDGEMVEFFENALT